MKELSKKVLILMSTYNGKNTIKCQVQSILDQKSADVSILIRDDGSDNETQKEIYQLIEQHPDRIRCIYGENIGWKRSFMELLYAASLEYDYYGFSDQDDIWMPDKIHVCMDLMEKDTEDCVKLAHCNSLSVDSELKIRDEQEYRIPYPSTHKAAIAMEHFQGCGMLWNQRTMQLIHSYRPVNIDLAHDYWVGLLGTFFGKIYFCEQPKFYHIRYEENSSADGNVWKGRLKRLKQLFSGVNPYMNPAYDLLCGYHSIMDEEDLNFLEILNTYQSNTRNKLSLLLDKEFRRVSFTATMLLKLVVLLGLY